MFLNTDSISTFPKLMEVYETFAKRLRGIEDLPLKVVTVQPVSPGNILAPFGLGFRVLGFIQLSNGFFLKMLTCFWISSWNSISKFMCF